MADATAHVSTHTPFVHRAAAPSLGPFIIYPGMYYVANKLFPGGLGAAEYVFTSREHLRRHSRLDLDLHHGRPLHSVCLSTLRPPVVHTRQQVGVNPSLLPCLVWGD